MSKEEGTVSDNPIEDGELWMFDSILILDEPILWIDNEHCVREAFGLLYNKGAEHGRDDFGFSLKHRIAYVMGASLNLLHNGEVDNINHVWRLPSGNRVDMEQQNMKELLVRLLQDRFSFRLMEFKGLIPCTSENKECVEGHLIVRPEIIERLLKGERPYTKKHIGEDE